MTWDVVRSSVSAMAAGEWLPLRILERPIFVAALIGYIVIGFGSRFAARRLFPKHNQRDADERGFVSDNRKRETLGRWLPSLIHAVLASVAAVIAGFALLPPSILSIEDAIMHSLAYFLGDLVVDRDLEYFLHHIGPILHCECMLRLGAVFWHTLRAGAILEIGNVVAHSAALLTWRKGTTWHRFNTWSFWISRPLSYYDGFMAWFADIPAAKRWTWMGVIPLLGIIGVYYSNTVWMFKMCRRRPDKRKRPTPVKVIDATALPASATGDDSPPPAGAVRASHAVTPTNFVSGGSLAKAQLKGA